MLNLSNSLIIRKSILVFECQEHSLDFVQIYFFVCFVELGQKFQNIGNFALHVHGQLFYCFVFSTQNTSDLCRCIEAQLGITSVVHGRNCPFVGEEEENTEAISFDRDTRLGEVWLPQETVPESAQKTSVLLSVKLYFAV
jgi:hypothetical protein